VRSSTLWFRLRLLWSRVEGWFWCKPTPKRRREFRKTVEIPAITDEGLLVDRLRFPDAPPRIGHDPNAITQELPIIRG
jgi:hypothetical protein